MPRKPADPIELTLVRLAAPGMSAKELLKRARKEHPEATRKEIVRAAFASIIAISSSDIDKALFLQDFALKTRGADDAN